MTSATNSSVKSESLSDAADESVVEHVICVVASLQTVKAVKDSLKSEGLQACERGITVTNAPSKYHSPVCSCNGAAKLIPTRLTRTASNPGGEVLDDAGIELMERINNLHCRSLVCHVVCVDRSHWGFREQKPINPLLRAVHNAMPMLPDSLLQHVGAVSAETLRQEFPPAFNVYDDLLLLPAAFPVQAPTWMSILACRDDREVVQGFLATLAKELDVSHIAINGHVPAEAKGEENVVGLALFVVGEASLTPEPAQIRHPSQITAVYGDLGPILGPFPLHVPDATDFQQALWTQATQFGLRQIWAPRYTMFSQGNVSEKQRIIRSIKEPEAFTAIDMFAGIGYFALPYAKAGAANVLCWDINPWSVEGLRRGATANQYTVKVFGNSALGRSIEHDVDEVQADVPEKFLVFNESNELARQRLARLRRFLPPVRHANCGMLPTAAMAWANAVHLIDRRAGGVIHIHESCDERKLDERVAEIQGQVQSTLDEILTDLGMTEPRHDPGTLPQANGATAAPDSRAVVVESVNKVKNMGPHIIHVVIDVRIPGQRRLVEKGFPWT